MLIPDVNLLVYAYNSEAPEHRAAKRWWEHAMSGEVVVGLPWVVMLGFLRIMTSRRILIKPLPVAGAISHIRSWIDQPGVMIVQPGPRHLDLLSSLAGAAGITGEMTTDLHLAALAVEHQAELHSNDTDFGRFSGLQWINPLASRR